MPHYSTEVFLDKQRGGCLRPYDLLKMATAGGARILGRNDLGPLEPGKAADLFLVDAGVLELAGATHDPANLLARTAVTGPVQLTMVNGKVVWRDGVMTGIDERDLAEKADRACTRAIRSRAAA